jgi:hypothetical protein
VAAVCSRARLAVLIVATVLAIAGVSCNRRSPLPEQGSIVPSPMPSPLAMFGIIFDPRGVTGSAPVTGTVILNQQAPAGGTVVGLSTGDQSAARVSASVTVPDGADRASFPIATQPVSTDRNVSISGSASGTSVGATLPVWALLPTSFSWFSDPGDLAGEGRFGRLTRATATFFLVTGAAGSMWVDVNGGIGDFWHVEFGAPRGMQLHVGSYEGAIRSSSRDVTHPGLDISGRGGCNTLTGRFDVREISFGANGMISHFDATFEQHCQNAPAALRGEFRFTAP